jgi:hypothetical protein
MEDHDDVLRFGVSVPLSNMDKMFGVGAKGNGALTGVPNGIDG